MGEEQQRLGPELEALEVRALTQRLQLLLESVERLHPLEQNLESDLARLTALSSFRVLELP